jgi:exo-beta-1,3-glucanase (GH17 family)
MLAKMNSYRIPTAHIGVTTSDVYWIYDYQPLVDAVDYILPNLHVFFDNTAIADAPAALWRLFDHYQDRVYPKKVIIGETGWPSAGKRKYH